MQEIIDVTCDAFICCSFICGYHVHEKAILMVILPLALAAARSFEDARTYLGLSITGHYALLPLLFTGNEYPIKARDNLIACINGYTWVINPRWSPVGQLLFDLEVEQTGMHPYVCGCIPVCSTLCVWVRCMWCR